MRPLVDHFALFNQMSSINRFSRDKMAKQENVLEHTGFVVLFCLFTSKAIEEDLGLRFDLGQLLTKAAVHDVDEAVLGDIPRPTKYMSAVTASEFKLAEERAVENIGNYFDIDILQDWLNAKDTTHEGRLVALADLAAVVYSLWSEVELYGNRSFMRVGREMHAALIQMRASLHNEEWEKQIIEELLSIVHKVRYADNSHPELSPGLKLDTMLKEEDHAKEDQDEEEIPF